MSETEAVICLTYENMQTPTTVGLQFCQLAHIHIMSDELLVHTNVGTVSELE